MREIALTKNQVALDGQRVIQHKYTHSYRAVATVDGQLVLPARFIMRAQQIIEQAGMPVWR